MRYQDSFWKCPYCVQMQNLSGQNQGGEMPYMMQPGMTGPSPQNPPCMGPSQGSPWQEPMPGGSIPGGSMSPGTMPGSFLPGGPMPSGTVPGSILPGNSMPGGPMPYYQMYGYPETYRQEQENERDMQRLKEMYPDVAKKVLQYVEEECDKMEYEGSIMFDEQPDRVMLMKITNDIYDKVKDEFELPEDSDKEEVMTMNGETRRRYPPRKNWLGDMVEVLLFQEMFRRRCRHRNCRNWF